MSHRPIGQEALISVPPRAVARRWSGCPRCSTGARSRRFSPPLYPSTRGEPAWPPLAKFKALLLAVWHDLPDVKLAEALEDRVSFRRFCGLAANEATPERSIFVRFRRTLISHGLDKRLFEAVTAQLTARAISIKIGTLVDATIIASASKDDDEARWVKHRNRASVHGFKAHVAADADTVLVEQLSVTPANVHDGRGGPAVLPDDPGEVFADSACRGQNFAEAVRAKGGVVRVAVTSMWGQDARETLARLDAWNAPIQRVRARIEKVFGTCTRSYGLRWRGLARATAYNLKRSLSLPPA